MKNVIQITDKILGVIVDDEHTWNLETVTNFKPLPQPPK